MNLNITMLNTTPLVKGLITGGLVLITTLLLGYFKIPASSGAQYLIYIFYGAGVGWTIYAYSRSDGYTGKFGALFNQGFRCFIIVTLVMVVFTLIYVMANPAFGDEMASYYREDLLKMKDVLPTEVDARVKSYRDSFTASMVSMTIFQYLVLGTIFTLGWSVVIIIRRKNNQ